uniref:SHSP domain-containing protein n=1 Tax=Vitis vinifera TaxID=29760 RepID=A5B818_VITVI|nr:hypothetical protein VITISV_041915 [Vitis vinifera]
MEEEPDIAVTKNGVGLTGSAAMGKVGSSFGLVDIGEFEDSYLFRVSLPGAARDEKRTIIRNVLFNIKCLITLLTPLPVLITDFATAGRFSCDIKPDGKILIKGVTTTGEKIVCRNFQIFKMQTQNLCPPGHFSISFQLPGPVDDQQISGGFGINGIFEGIVKKR